MSTCKCCHLNWGGPNLSQAAFCLHAFNLTIISFNFFFSPHDGTPDKYTFPNADAGSRDNPRRSPRHTDSDKDQRNRHTPSRSMSMKSPERKKNSKTPSKSDKHASTKTRNSSPESKRSRRSPTPSYDERQRSASPYDTHRRPRSKSPERHHSSPARGRGRSPTKPKRSPQRYADRKQEKYRGLPPSKALLPDYIELDSSKDCDRQRSRYLQYQCKLNVYIYKYYYENKIFSSK